METSGIKKLSTSLTYVAKYHHHLIIYEQFLKRGMPQRNKLLEQEYQELRLKSSLPMLYDFFHSTFDRLL